MKSFKSRLAIIIAMMVFVTSFTFIGVSAEDQTPGAAPAAAEATTPAAAPRVCGSWGWNKCRRH